MHRHLAVLGSPISHSRSPFIHRAAYEVLGLPWHYEAIECEESRLRALLDSRGEEWLGFSVTMPLKSEAHRLSSVLDPIAIESGVVNTLLRLVDQGGRPSWAGFNTDVAGLAAALREARFDPAHVLVLGAGATAVSAVIAARMLGAQRVSVCARRPEVAAELVARFAAADSQMPGDAHSIDDIHADLLDSASTVISTLPGEAAEKIELPDELSRIPLFDVAYDPWPSPLAGRWQRNGGVSRSGLDMLVHQALAQVRIFVNGDPALPLKQESEMLAAMRQATQRG